MFTTHDDYCDGGNALGIVLDMELYQKQLLNEAIVAQVVNDQILCTVAEE